MRRTEAIQDAQMMRLLEVLGRYEAAEFNQMKAAELLGVGEHTFRRWRDPDGDDGDAGCLTVGLAKSRPSGFRPLGRVRRRRLTAAATPTSRLNIFMSDWCGIMRSAVAYRSAPIRIAAAIAFKRPWRQGRSVPPMRVSRTLEHLGIEYVAAYSPQALNARFPHPADRLTEESALVGVAKIEATDVFIRDVCLLADNARFAVEGE
jgi:hypothetical protein